MKNVGIAARLLPAFLLLALAPACRSDSPPPPSGGAPTGPAPTPAPAETAAHRMPEPVKTDDARAVLDRWVAAQNDGQFDAYAALYAPRFEGVRRSGPRVVHLDRARWMKEREAMFMKKMEVKVSDVSVVPSAAGAQLTFTQRWTSGTYSDEGPKRVVLTRAGGSLLIGREEMLRSTLQKPDAAPPLPLDRFALVVRAPLGSAGAAAPAAIPPPAGSTAAQAGAAPRALAPLIVLDAAPQDGWADTMPWLLTRGDVVMVARTVDARKLPPELAAYRGKRLQLHGKAGLACEADVTSFNFLGRVRPHFGTVALWDGKGEPKTAPISDGEIARDAWELSGSGGRMLVARVEPVKGSCDAALWARVAVADKAAPELAEAAPADDATRDRALDALRKLPAYAELQKEFEQQGGKPEQRWEEHGGAKPVVLAAKHPSGVTLVTVSIRVGKGCDEFGATLSAVWEEKDGKLELVREPEGQELAPFSAGDVDGDGKLELIVEEGVLRTSGTRYDRWDQLQVPNLDCDC